MRLRNPEIARVLNISRVAYALSVIQPIHLERFTNNVVVISVYYLKR